MSESPRKSSATHLEVRDDEAARRGRRRSTQSTKSSSLTVRPSSTGRRVSSPGLFSDGKTESSVETGYASASRRSSVFAGSSGRTSLESSAWTSQDRDTDDQNVERSPTSKIEETKSEDDNLQAAEVVKSEETTTKSPDKSEKPQQPSEQTKIQTMVHTTTKHFTPKTVQYAHLEQSLSAESARLDSGDRKTADKLKASSKEVKPSKSPKQSKMSTRSESATGARPRVSRSTRDKSTSTSPKKSGVKTPSRKPGSLPTPSKKETPYNLRPKKPTVEESPKVSDSKGKASEVIGAAMKGIFRSRSKSKTPKKEDIPTSAKSPDVVVYKPVTSKRVSRQVDLSPPIRLKSVEIKGKPKVKKEKSPKKPPPDTEHIRPPSATLLLGLKKMDLHDKDDSASEPLIDALETCPPDEEDKDLSGKQEMVKPPDFFFPRHPAQVGRFLHDDPDCVSPDSSPDIEDDTTQSSRVMDSEMATVSRDPLKDSGVSSHTPSQVSSFEEDPAAEKSGLEEDSALKPKLQRQKRMKEQSSSGSDDDDKYRAICGSPLKRPSHTPKKENKE